VASDPLRDTTPGSDSVTMVPLPREVLEAQLAQVQADFTSYIKTMAGLRHCAGREIEKLRGDLCEVRQILDLIYRLLPAIGSESRRDHVEAVIHTAMRFLSTNEPLSSTVETAIGAALTSEVNLLLRARVDLQAREIRELRSFSLTTHAILAAIDKEHDHG